MTGGADQAKALRLLQVFGMRRSGNHALIAWLRRNIGAKSVFLNACAACGDPYETFEALETPCGMQHGPAFRETRWFAQYPERRETTAHIVSHEDLDPLRADLPGGWPDDARWQRIVLHRSFLNWVASFYRLVAVKKAGTPWGVRDPSDVARFFATYAAHLEAANRPGHVSVSFDGWLSEPPCRAALLRTLGLPGRDLSLGPVAEYGGGSSFDRGTPRPDDLRNRWQACLPQPAFRALLGDACRDFRLMAQLDQHYPLDAARLRSLAETDRPAASAVHPGRTERLQRRAAAGMTGDRA